MPDWRTTVWAVLGIDVALLSVAVVLDGHPFRVKALVVLAIGVALLGLALTLPWVRLYNYWRWRRMSQAQTRRKVRRPSGVVVVGELTALHSRAGRPQTPVAHFMTGESPHRKLDVGTPRALIFTKPRRQILRTDELPADIPCGAGRITVTLISGGVEIEEFRTIGDHVMVEIVYAA